jgi:cytochrome c biogenesis protein ResB
LKYKGVEIYQERFTGKIKYARIKIISSNQGSQVMEVKSGERFTPEGSETVFRAVRITPDFIQLKNSSSPEVIRVSQRPVGFSHQALQDYKFSLIDTKTKEATKLKAVRDPGKALIWFATLGMLAGFAVVFFLPHQQIWLSIRSEKDRSVITLAGTTTKDPASFEEIFKNITDSLK